MNKSLFSILRADPTLSTLSMAASSMADRYYIPYLFGALTAFHAI